MPHKPSTQVLIGLLMLGMGVAAHSGTVPQDSYGLCPMGWKIQASVCYRNPGTSMPQDSSGLCPLGWKSHGSYCYIDSNKTVVPADSFGLCLVGLKKHGTYCHN